MNRHSDQPTEPDFGTIFIAAVFLAVFAIAVYQLFVG